MRKGEPKKTIESKLQAVFARMNSYETIMLFDSVLRDMEETYFALMQAAAFLHMENASDSDRKTALICKGNLETVAKLRDSLKPFTVKQR